MYTTSDFQSCNAGLNPLESPRFETARTRNYRQSSHHQDSCMLIEASMQVPRRAINMKANLTGRSVKGAGALGTSRSPCSQSGMDPDMVRGRSSQLNFAMAANEKQI